MKDQENKKEEGFTPEKIIGMSGLVFFTSILVFSGAVKESLWHVLLPASGITYVFLSFYEKKVLGRKK